jgi:hypothetical protein
VSDLNKLLLRLLAADVAFWFAASIIAAPLSAAAPACCRIFGIDLTYMLGRDPAVCGEIRDADERNEAQALIREERQRATQCALDAQASGRPFVYTYRMLAPPDIDLIVQAAAGADGRRMLLKMGNSKRQNIRTIEACATLTVLPDGKVRTSGCTDVAYHY